MGIIDLGTNTFHLLIARMNGDCHEIIYRSKIPVKVGLGGINRNIITEEGKARALDAMRQFKLILTKNQVTKVYAFGTSALRNAENGKELATNIKSETGIEVNIISGEREAEYIFEGVRSAVTMNDTSLIVDIGGGSVEFIIGNEKELLWKQSFEIGAQRLLEKFQKHDPIHPKERQELDSFFQKTLSTLNLAISRYKPKDLIGSSGTFDTLSEIHCIQSGHSFDPLAPETPLSFENFHKIFDDLATKNRAERMKIPGMIEMRVDMIVVACCLIDYLLKSFTDFVRIRVSSYSLKEGVLASLLHDKV